MTMIETSCAIAIGVFTLMNAGGAMASSDLRTLCAPPAERNMTVYRPACAGVDARREVAFPPTCAPQWLALEIPCPSLESVDAPIGRSLFDPYDVP